MNSDDGFVCDFTPILENFRRCLHETHDLLDNVGRSRCPLARPSEEEEHDASLLAAPQRR